MHKGQDRENTKKGERTAQTKWTLTLDTNRKEERKERERQLTLNRCFTTLKTNIK